MFISAQYFQLFSFSAQYIWTQTVSLSLKQIIFRLTIHSATIHLDANSITLIEPKYFLLNDFATIHFDAKSIAKIEANYFLLNNFVLIFSAQNFVLSQNTLTFFLLKIGLKMSNWPANLQVGFFSFFCPKMNQVFKKRQAFVDCRLHFCSIMVLALYELHLCRARFHPHISNSKVGILI